MGLLGYSLFCVIDGWLLVIVYSCVIDGWLLGYSLLMVIDITWL